MSDWATRAVSFNPLITRTVVPCIYIFVVVPLKLAEKCRLEWDRGKLFIVKNVLMMVLHSAVWCHPFLRTGIRKEWEITKIVLFWRIENSPPARRSLGVGPGPASVEQLTQNCTSSFMNIHEITANFSWIRGFFIPAVELGADHDLKKHYFEE